VIVNDGSTSTAAILKNYGDHIQVITQTNGCLSVARNAGVCRSTGRYLALVDSADIWLPGKLKTMVRRAGAEPTGKPGVQPVPLDRQPRSRVWRFSKSPKKIGHFAFQLRTACRYVV